jgi:hypothetical protein
MEKLSRASHQSQPVPVANTAHLFHVEAPDRSGGIIKGRCGWIVAEWTMIQPGACELGTKVKV